MLQRDIARPPPFRAAGKGTWLCANERHNLRMRLPPPEVLTRLVVEEKGWKKKRNVEIPRRH